MRFFVPHHFNVGTPANVTITNPFPRASARSTSSLDLEKGATTFDIPTPSRASYQPHPGWVPMMPRSPSASHVRLSPHASNHSNSPPESKQVEAQDLHPKPCAFPRHIIRTPCSCLSCSDRRNHEYLVHGPTPRSDYCQACRRFNMRYKLSDVHCHQPGALYRLMEIRYCSGRIHYPCLGSHMYFLG